jgi:hypothetical protein
MCSTEHKNFCLEKVETAMPSEVLLSLPPGGKFCNYKDFYNVGDRMGTSP